MSQPGVHTVGYIDFIKISPTADHISAGFRETGGYEKLVDSFFDAVATNRSLQVPSDPDSGLCGGVPEDSMHLIRKASAFSECVIFSI